MEIEFIIRTILEILLIILIIAGFIREGRIMYYEMEIHNRLKNICSRCADICEQLRDINRKH